MTKRSQKKLVRLCLVGSCRKPFIPTDRKREWYCPACRKKPPTDAGVREISCRDLSAAAAGLDQTGN